MPTGPVRVIKPNSARVLPDVAELWRFRDLLRMFALRDFRLRYRQTVVGVGWVFIQPLVAAGAFTVVFGVVADLSSEGVPYFLFSLAGMIAWTAFSSAFIRSGGSLLQSSQLVSKSYFPRVLLPLSSVASVMIDFAVGFGLLVVLTLGNGRGIPIQALLSPLWLLALVLLALGPGLSTAAVSATYRDVQYTTPLITQVLLYMSPVAYSAVDVPDSVRPFYDLNPVAALLDGFRWSILGTEPPSIARVAWGAGAAVVSAAIGLLVFNRFDRRCGR